MEPRGQFYIDGQWTTPCGTQQITSVNPSTEQANGSVILGNSQDVEAAVAAAWHAFPVWSAAPADSRLELLDRIAVAYEERWEQLALAIHEDMGAPLWLARGPQTALGRGHLNTARAALASWREEQAGDNTRIRSEAIGVCGLITPWNWPINQIACKVFPALAAGCTMVLKPSELAPRSAEVFAAILHAAELPAGVFNLVHGTGVEVGTALARHPDIRMVSFTGSNAAGIAVAKNAADTVKRVAQELGGKSPYILCEDSLFETSVPAAIKRCFINSGQTCTAPTRLLVPQRHLAWIEDIAAQCVAGIETGNGQPGSLGPLVSKTQFERVQGYITMGLDEGARLIAGGPGRVDGLARGYYVRPTIFSGVANTMAVAREEIFGPVLCIIPYRDEAHAVVLANDSAFGLAAYVSSEDLDNARRIAEQLEAGVVHINEPERDIDAPFGGYKQSGNGREWGRWGLREFLETKAMIGWGADS